MAKQRYRQRESGLIVSEDSLSIPKPNIPKPWYVGAHAPQSARAGNIQFRNGKILFTPEGKIAFGVGCCCETPVSPCLSCDPAPAFIYVSFDGWQAGTTGDISGLLNSTEFEVPCIWENENQHCSWEPSSYAEVSQCSDFNANNLPYVGAAIIYNAYERYLYVLVSDWPLNLVTASFRKDLPLTPQHLDCTDPDLWGDIPLADGGGWQTACGDSTNATCSVRL